MNREPGINNDDQTPKEKERPKSFVMYESFVQAAKELGEELGNKFIMAVCDYGLYGQEPEETTLRSLFILIKPLIDAAQKRRKQNIENGKKGGEFGKLGGARKGNQNARKQPQNNPKTTPKQPLNINDNINIDGNDNVDEKENGKINSSLSLNPDNKDSALLPLFSCYSKLRSNHEWIEMLCRRYHERGKPVMEYKEMIEQLFQFIGLLELRGEEFKTLKDAKSHFVNWMDGRFKRHEGPFCMVGAKDVLPGAENVSGQKFEEMNF